MLAWPHRAKKAMAVFFTKWNDFDVYVEDTAKNAKSLYVALINNALKEKCKVNDVFPLGDRKAVLDACAADQGSGGRPRIYLADGDLDLIAGIPISPLKRLFIHDVYAFESYLFCQDALINLLHEENPSLTLEEVKATFNFPYFLFNLAPLLDLFIVFGLTKALDPSLPTIKLGLGPFLNDDKIGLDQVRVAAFCSERTDDLLKVTTQRKLNAEEKKIRNRIKALRQETDAIAAREFLFPLFQIYKGTVGLKLSASKDAQKMRLAKSANLDTHARFIDALKEAATA